MSTLEQRLEAGAAPAWRPDKDDPDTIVGEIVSIDVATGEYEPYPLVVIKQDDGTEIAVHGFRTVLKNELIRQRPRVGERIGIKFLGDIATKPGSRFKSYTGYVVKVERAQGAAFDWGQLAADPEPTDINPDYNPPAAAQPETTTEPDDAGEDGIPY